MSAPGLQAGRPAGGWWWREPLAVLAKDLRSELRARSALNSIFLFALTSLVVISFTIVHEGLGLTEKIGPGGIVAGDTLTRRLLLSALLWVVLFFSSIAGMARVFVKEEEQRTSVALHLAARPSSIYLGKLLFNALLITAVAAVVAPLFLLFFRPRLNDPALFVTVLLLGCLSLAAASTILAAIVARSGGSSAIFAVLGFPLLIFVLIIAISCTADAFAGGRAAAMARNQLMAMVSYLVAVITASLMLFDQVWQA